MMLGDHSCHLNECGEQAERHWELPRGLSYNNEFICDMICDLGWNVPKNVKK